MKETFNDLVNNILKPLARIINETGIDGDSTDEKLFGFDFR